MVTTEFVTVWKCQPTAHEKNYCHVHFAVGKVTFHGLADGKSNPDKYTLVQDASMLEVNSVLLFFELCIVLWMQVAFLDFFKSSRSPVNTIIFCTSFCFMIGYHGKVMIELMGFYSYCAISRSHFNSLSLISKFKFLIFMFDTTQARSHNTHSSLVFMSLKTQK